MTHIVIYIPGIGDHRTYGQDKGISWWRLLGAQGLYRPVMWRGDEHFEPKLQRLLTEIDEYLAQGHQVSLLGFSAGASAALNVFAARRDKIAGVVLISGKINRIHATAKHYFTQNPAFYDSLVLMTENLATFTAEDKARMLTLNPITDIVVPYKDAIIPGVKSWRTLAFSHAMSIAVALTVYAPFVVRHLRRLKR